jgi:hypothetical protein
MITVLGDEIGWPPALCGTGMELALFRDLGGYSRLRRARLGSILIAFRLDRGDVFMFARLIPAMSLLRSLVKVRRFASFNC